MKKKRLLLLLGSISLVAILAALPIMTACEAEAPPAEKKVTIGFLGSYTGWFSSYDIQQWNELEVLADMINENGGITINGEQYMVELVTEDCKSSLDGVTAATNRLVYDRKVKFIIGPAAFFTMAASPICAENKVIQVSGYNVKTPLECGPDVPYSFIGTGGALGGLYSLVEMMKAKFPDAKKLAMVSPAGGINEYLEPPTRAHLEAYGYSPVGEWVRFADDAVDFYPYAAKLAAIEEADLICGYQGIAFHIGSILKPLRALGCDKVFVYRSPASCHDVLEVCGKEAAYGLVTQGITPFAPDNPPILDELITRYRDKYGPDATFNTADNTFSFYTLVQVLNEVQSLDPEVVKAGWEALDRQKIDTLWGTGTICGTETYGIKGHALAHPHPAQMLDNGEVSFFGWWDCPAIP